ncbi:helix-turn-helix domain-containing protein [Labrenzia sp. PHM005]|uniref:MarR family transcriptional regulator n=1 Tax=Labrenzia sp. PHM005 TaxID=2590016 RepID=UPI00113FE67B|nr:helix-turn-helix domain-containing protein [Labrenzia sp. PHM005]QDG75343.1 hypothetical protein FJ695_05390 [Labrenzia sp. PHM005]
MSGIVLIVSIMVVCGGLGGFGAWLLSPGFENEGNDIRYKGFGYIVVGIIAAVAVPLFLSMAESNLIDTSGGFANLRDGFVFAGFCLVAGFSSRAFLSSISEKVLNELKEKTREAEQIAEDSSEEVEELRRVIAEEATPVAPDANIQGEVLNTIVSDLNDDQKKVLQATGGLTMRTATGIARSAEMPRTEAAKVVDDLISKGLAERTTSPKTGNLRFKVTSKGVSVLNALPSSKL